MVGGRLANADSRLKLGVFSMNCSGGTSASTLPRDYRVTWEHSSAIVRRAEAIGFDFVIPVAKWRGFGGETDFYGESFETLTWAAGIAAQTSAITVVATCHVPVIHPTFVAKAGATVDAISGGRFALNVVMGWYPAELGQFGIEPAEHDIRYAHGAEWLTALKRLWTEDAPFDFDGRWTRISDGLSKPKPVHPPQIINAGTSPAGIDFAARQCDILLASRNTLDGTKAFVDTVKDTARERHGRSLRVLNVGQVICAPTEAEALARKQAILDSVDKVAAENFMKFLGLKSNSYDETLLVYRELFVTAAGGFPLVGTPEQVARQMGEMAAAGIDGFALGFYDYYDELGFFGENVMPLLRKAGLHV
ncbi:LLM class flavin-dependent oxidoreductase [Zavarzinia sp.]|uniref:LLM class flavin-dependent oxidoreductase n=1 Tax=Zavarzinia sp. TaxID=2027920 RepID=UPI0035635568